MAAPNLCPTCGFPNVAGWTVCANCGSPATGSPVGATTAMETAPQKQIAWTKTGILLLLVGTLVSWVPVIGLVGSAVTLIGAILVILGRDAFGRTHRQNVIASIILFFVGVVIAFVGTVILVASAAGAILGAPNEFALAAVLQETFTNVVLLIAVGAFVSGLGSVFFTYALQKQGGQILLWAAYVATVDVQFATLFFALPLLSDVARILAHAVISGASLDAGGIAIAVNEGIGQVQLLEVIPAALYAVANYLAWTRIDRGEIPQPPTPPIPGGAAHAPPTSPM